MYSFDLGDYKWKNRLLLIFSTQASDFTLSSQYDIYKKNQSGFEERDLKIFHISESKIPKKFGQLIPENTKAELKERYGIPDSEFAIVLIGKDGTEKLRTNDVLSAQKLFSVIDAMPMRQQEK